LLVDVNRIAELSPLAAANGTLHLGATTRMRTLELDPLVRQTIPLLAAAASWVGHVQIRNRGTVGGSIAHADPAAELPAICLLLDGEITAEGPTGSRTISAAEFFLGFLTTTLGEDELLTGVRLPIPAVGEHWGFHEFAQRRGDFALAGAAVTLGLADDGMIERARIVVFGTADRPVRTDAVADRLVGQRPDPALLDETARRAAADATVDDPRPDAAYRRTVTATMVRRALDDALAGSSGVGRPDREVA
jgi:carbon-monoxide dehydrogenase medium subunit